MEPWWISVQFGGTAAVDNTFNLASAKKSGPGQTLSVTGPTLKARFQSMTSPTSSHSPKLPLLFSGVLALSVYQLKPAPTVRMESP